MSRFMSENTVLTPPPAEIRNLMKAFENNGYQILVVGGAVRDLILGLEPKDYDLATNATPAQVKEVVDGLEGYRYVLGPQAEKSVLNLTSLVTIPNEKEAITYDNLAEAIAAFERTLISSDRFDVYLEGDAKKCTICYNFGCAYIHGFYRYCKKKLCLRE